MSDLELEEAAKDRAGLRNATFDVEERPDGTFLAAFKVPSPIEDYAISQSAEGPDRRTVIAALLWSDDLRR